MGAMPFRYSGSSRLNERALLTRTRIWAGPLVTAMPLPPTAQSIHQVHSGCCFRIAGDGAGPTSARATGLPAASLRRPS